ncbi:VacJ family lipoprotein [Paraferrimonas sp. SM1919]|uniref:MlaA family lipoprotein n=1 Tax=Paraferrimonas sp. SM1919 TaxID=2662263 RepID=UPI0013D57D6D|nr:VacJ family lipoprotein [Paraferrimonas sp. SM1919]
MKAYSSLLLSLLLTLSVSVQAQDNQEQANPDPFEGFNRAMWDFNYLYLDKYLLRPAATGYANYVPAPIQSGLYNITLNLEEPSSVVNNLLQWKPEYAANATGRFLINSTFGILGIFDVAGQIGLERKQDQFSEVLGYWGVPDGPYIMMPVLGPYVTREATDFVDGLYFPLSEMTLWVSAAKWGIKNLHKRAMALEQDQLIDGALDPYLFVRESYLQHVNYSVLDGQLPQVNEDDEALEDFMDELD